MEESLERERDRELQNQASRKSSRINSRNREKTVSQSGDSMILIIAVAAGVSASRRRVEYLPAVSRFLLHVAVSMVKKEIHKILV